jgi:hypothetical protein
VLTIGELLAPGLMKFEELRLAVDLGSGEHRGHTQANDAGVPIRVAMGVNVTRMRELLARVFGTTINPKPSSAAYRKPQPPVE